MSDETATPAPRFVIITGLSGSGKGTVLRVLEDLGYYAVDNLPLDLISKFVDLCRASPNIDRAALVVDVREGEALERFPSFFAELPEDARTLLVFLEASDQVLQQRFSETRRPHPLGAGGSVLENIAVERGKLARLRDLAELRIDTSKYNIHDLRKLIEQRFAHSEQRPVLLVTVESFGFKYGLPTDSDLVLDVRFLPNPHYLPGGKDLTGHDRKVIEYINSFEQTAGFLNRASDLLAYLMPHYVAEGKSYLTISIGCTGGRHRSVMMSEVIAERLERTGVAVKTVHRDLHRG